jgi:hypothetical protein
LTVVTEVMAEVMAVETEAAIMEVMEAAISEEGTVVVSLCSFSQVRLLTLLQGDFGGGDF